MKIIPYVLLYILLRYHAIGAEIYTVWRCCHGFYLLLGLSYSGVSVNQISRATMIGSVFYKIYI